MIATPNIAGTCITPHSADLNHRDLNIGISLCVFTVDMAWSYSFFSWRRVLSEYDPQSTPFHARCIVSSAHWIFQIIQSLCTRLHPSEYHNFDAFRVLNGSQTDPYHSLMVLFHSPGCSSPFPANRNDIPGGGLPIYHYTIIPLYQCTITPIAPPKH